MISWGFISQVIVGLDLKLFEGLEDLSFITLSPLA